MRIRTALLLVAACACLAGVVAAWRVLDCMGTTLAFPRVADQRLEPFQTAGASFTEPEYAGLFSYFVDGFLAYRTPEGTGAAYPGWPMGDEGTDRDRSLAVLEGFSRVAPLLAAWLKSGRPAQVALASGSTTDVAALLREGILQGTDPEAAGYWGAIDSSRIVEAADIALAIRLSRAAVWQNLSPDQQRQVAVWLYGVNGKQTVDNNWHLFVVLVNVVLDDLGMPADLDEAERRYARFKSFHVGDGWFRDGPSGDFDYYNAWGIHYPLFWIREIQPGWDPVFLRSALARFAARYKYFFGPNGIPAMGRSVCYRGAAPAPLLAAALDGSGAVSVGEARRALDLTWGFLVRNGAVADGAMTQGYCGADPRILDAYSGPASCLWSLRSLVVAFSVPATAPLWQSAGEPLPVERGDFSVDIAPVEWRIAGTAATGEVRLFIGPNRGKPPPALKEYPLYRRVTDALLCRSRRPENHAAKYDAESYSSLTPFCGCRT